ncbi:uncharacterized protein [Penaeus vannamei]|uniref:uncharacterized protein n=1 Tax=Penaeus vannamei TaxID=6689 RepID=UPI00387FAA48
MARGLHAVLAAIWQSGSVPPDLLRRVGILLWKGKGDRWDCRNHRGITLLSIPGKVLAHILLRRIRDHLLRHQRLEQSGFTPEWLPARLALAAMAWLGFINLYMVRINLSVIIVAMVSRNATVNRRAPCLSLFNNTQGLETDDRLQLTENEEGEMNWDETIQGFVMGSFFYGYAMSQIIGGRVSELYGTKWVFGGCIFSGGISALLSPIAARAHYGVFIVLRIIQGLCQIMLKELLKQNQKNYKQQLTETQKISDHGSPRPCVPKERTRGHTCTLDQLLTVNRTGFVDNKPEACNPGLWLFLLEKLLCFPGTITSL